MLDRHGCWAARAVSEGRARQDETPRPGADLRGDGDLARRAVRSELALEGRRLEPMLGDRLTPLRA